MNPSDSKLREAAESAIREHQTILYWGEERENAIGPLAAAIASDSPAICTTL